MKIKGKCDCGELLSCGCTLSFSSYVASSVSVLDVGTLQGGSCSFAKYVIDWYRDGEKYMVSGVGDDPDIQAHHPFTGTAAIPVIGGQYVPVLRYVILTGQTSKIFTSKKPCRDWCQFSGTLPTITVSSLDCTSVNQTGDYQYKLSYVSTQDYSLASRIFRWFTSADTKFLAIKFDAYTVADKIEIFFKDETTPITAWIVGSQYNTIQHLTIPYQTNGSLLYVLTLPEFQTGDYITFKITPSVLESNINTNWDFRIKCLTASSDFAAECALLSQQFRTFPDISTFSWTDQLATNCRWLFNTDFGSPILPITSFPELRKYVLLALTTTSLASTTTLYTTGEYSVPFARSQYGNGQFQLGGATTCNAAYGTITLSKPGAAQYLITCDSIDDFNAYQTRYNTLMASSWATGWNSDPATDAYYRFFSFSFKIATSCGDSGITKTIYGHITSTWTFDSGTKTITFDVVNVTNQYVPFSSCDTTGNSINTSIGYVTTTINSTTNIGTTNVRNNGFEGNRITMYQTAPTTVFSQISFSLKTLISPCYPDAGCIDPSYHYNFMLMVSKIYVKITDNNDIPNNYEVYTGYDDNTGCSLGNSSANYILRYKMVNGVQTFPIP